MGVSKGSEVLYLLNIYNKRSNINARKIAANIISDLRVLNKTKGIVFLTENLEEYRIRIDDNKKLIIDDVINGTNNIAEIQLYSSGSSPPNIENE